MVSYFPHRVQEGYGLNTDSLDGLKAQGVSLVITVDCGISNSAEVAYAQAHGLDVIVTDHHNVMSSLPPALATVNAEAIRLLLSVLTSWPESGWPTSFFRRCPGPRGNEQGAGGDAGPGGHRHRGRQGAPPG